MHPKGINHTHRQVCKIENLFKRYSGLILPVGKSTHYDQQAGTGKLFVTVFAGLQINLPDLLSVDKPCLQIIAANKVIFRSSALSRFCKQGSSTDTKTLYPDAHKT